MFIFNHLIMKTPNNGVETSQNQPQKMWAIKGLSAKIVTALAAIGIATSVEKVEGAITIIGPNFISGTTEQSTQAWISKLYSDRTITESRSDFTIVITGADALSGGILTVSWVQRVLTGNRWFSWTEADINHELRGGITDGATVSLATLNGPEFTNLGLNSFSDTNPVQGFKISQPFSFDITIPAGNTSYSYTLQSLGHTQNADATVMLAWSLDANGDPVSGINLNFSPIPEPSSVWLLTGGAIALLMRRKREKSEEKNI